jgi:hypothetical protein
VKGGGQYWRCGEGGYICKHLKDRRGDAQGETRGFEGGYDRALLKEIRVVADLAELHEDVDDLKQRPRRQLRTRGSGGDELVVEEALAARKAADDDVLELGGELLFDVALAG